MKRSTHYSLFGSLLVTLAMAGCASDTTTMGENCMPPEEGDGIAAGSVNNVCPIGGDGVGAGSPTVEHNGTVIALCCEGCVTKWKAMSTEERDEIRTKALGS